MIIPSPDITMCDAKAKKIIVIYCQKDEDQNDSEIPSHISHTNLYDKV